LSNTMIPIVRLLLAVLFIAGAYAQTPRDLKMERSAPPLPDKRARWAMVVGVSSYQYAPPAAQLRYAHRDAQEFANFLRSTEGGGLPADHVRLLTDSSATAASIRAALQVWLPKSAGPNDVVYLFFAGHAVVAERGETYFVAHDSDPQNLHATGISFREVNDALTNKLKAATVILLADACHAGGIGWTSDPASPTAAQRSLEALGTKDRAFLKLLASRPSERSFEDDRWGGGHGIFTYSILSALRGAAERERDGFIRVSELIDYVSRVVPEQTGSQQNPRFAGNFEGALPIAALSSEQRAAVAPPASVRITGRRGTAIYVDHQFRGAIRDNGELAIDTTAGEHTLSIDVPGSEAFEQTLAVRVGLNLLDLQKSAEFALFRLRAAVQTGNIVGPGGAWEYYNAQSFTPGQAPAAEALITGALESTGQECVSDYVQSSTNGLKRPMFLRASQAFNQLRELRPGDSSLPAKALFCQARAQIAAGEFEAAVESLKASLAIDQDFACSHNALGVALGRLGRGKEARAAFEKAAQLTPAWALPPHQIAQQLIANGDLNGAVPYVERAVSLNPKAVGLHWSLARIYRLLGRGQDFIRAAQGTIGADRNYAPIYSELGLFYESVKDNARAAQAFDTYLLLAPNFADSAEIRNKAQLNRAATQRRPPSLRSKRP
jgi:uncharacterized caspase-like protein/tetratricopeptide (TPR) repeat protein